MDDNQFNLVAIVKEKEYLDDIQGFYEYFYHNIRRSKNETYDGIDGNVFYDSDLGFYKALGERRLSFFQIFSRTMFRLLGKVPEEVKQKATRNGDFSLMGGLMVVSKDKIWYEYTEKHLGDSAPLDEVLDAFERATGTSVDRVALNALV